MSMRKFSKHTPEQIVVKLERAEALGGEGMSTALACRVLGISEATLCRWRQRYGSMSSPVNTWLSVLSGAWEPTT